MKNKYPRVGEYWIQKGSYRLRKIVYMTNFSTDPITMDNCTKIITRNLLGTLFVMPLDTFVKEMVYSKSRLKLICRNILDRM